MEQKDKKKYMHTLYISYIVKIVIALSGGGVEALY
jgi:hypothetical protein